MGGAAFVLAAFAAAVRPAPAAAQSYARYAVPDTGLVRVLAASRAEFEGAWNALLVAEIRSTLVRADSARGLAELERRIARAEPHALGTRIAPDALALRHGWQRRGLGTRVAAAAAESLAAIARSGRAFGRADSLLRGALAGYRSLGERRRTAWVLGSLGANALVARRNTEAAAWYDTALVARRALGDSILIGNTLNDLGQTWLQLGRPDAAARVLSEAAVLRAAQGRQVQLGATLNYMGLALASLGLPDSAIACYRRSLVLTASRGDSLNTLVVLSNYALVLTDNGHAGEAIAVNERALHLAGELGNTGAAAIVENNLGQLYRKVGRFSDALAHTDRSIAAYAEQGDLSELAQGLSRKGNILIAIGDPTAARTVLARAQSVADSLDDPQVQAVVLATLAIAAEQLGDVSGAGRLGARAFTAAVASGDSGTVHGTAATLGFLATTRRDPAEAERWLERAVAAGADAGLTPEQRANDLTGLANARQLQGRYDEAGRGHQEALELARSHGLTNQMLWSLCSLGDLEERRGNPGLALAEYARAVAIADTLRTLQHAERASISLFANRLFMFEAMIHLLGKLDAAHPDSGYGEQAFAWAERARARAYLDLVAASGAGGRRAATLTLPAAQGLLRGDREALLEYSVGDSSTTLWVVRRDRWHRYVLPPRAVLQPRIQALRRGLADRSASGAAATLRMAHALYGVLVAPAESLLAGVDHLIVAPDGALSLIPFEALLVRPPLASGAAPRGGFLVERFAVSYTPSASVLATLRAGSGSRSVVAIGNPDFGDSAAAGHGGHRLEALPNTAAELAMLAATAGARNVTTLSRRDACRSRVLGLKALPHAGIVHFATHGDVNELEPERSGLWLAPDPGGSGPSRIEVADIMKLELSADLVTLSACETGLGRLESGEGVLGLSRAFLAAGARSVAVSLWPVNDRSTARLMAAFYRGMLGRGEPRAEALARAKRELIAAADTRAPFYWAPFVLIGRTQP